MKKDVYKIIAIVTGIFMLTVTIMLTMNYIQLRDITPLQTEVMETLKTLNEASGDNETLQLQIRQLDLLSRKAYFVQEEHQKMGIYLLVAMSVVLIVCLRGYYADIKHIAPKHIDALDEWLMKSKSRKYVHWLAGGLAIAAIVVIIGANPNVFRGEKVVADAEIDATSESLIAEQIVESEASTSETIAEEQMADDAIADSTADNTDGDKVEQQLTPTDNSPTTVSASASTPEAAPTTEKNSATDGATQTQTATTVSSEKASETEPAATSENSKPTEQSATTTANRVNHTMFRGRNSNGHSAAKGIPTKWDLASKSAIAWQQPLTSKQGFSSPVVYNDRIFFTGGDAAAREIYCHDLNSGNLLWSLKADNIAGSPATPPQVAGNTGYAAATAATDGKYVCAIFATGDIICADMEGKRVWAKNLGVPDNQYGYVSSLLIYGNSLFVQFDNNNIRKVCAIDIATGNIRWQKERGGKISWSSPIIAMVDGKAQLILMGNPNVTAYNPSSGEELWSVEGMGGEVCPSPCSADGMIFAANEYAKLMAINGKDGSIAWESTDYMPEVSSPVVAAGKVYIATSYGVLAVFNAKTGELIAEKELNVELYSSPMVVEGKIYLIATNGQVYIFSTDDAVTQINSFESGEPTYATPAFLDGKIIIRTERSLYCVAEK